MNDTQRLRGVRVTLTMAVGLSLLGALGDDTEGKAFFLGYAGLLFLLVLCSLWEDAFTLTNCSRAEKAKAYCGMLVAGAALGLFVWARLGGFPKQLDEINPRLIGRWLPETRDDIVGPREILTIYKDRIHHRDINSNSAKDEWIWKIGTIRTQWHDYFLTMLNSDGTF